MDIPTAIQKYLLPGAGPTPAQLYEEAAPRVQAMLKQYDNVSPLVDFATRNWVATVATFVALGAIAAIGGNFLYDWLRKK